MRLYVDDQLLIDDFTDHGSTQDSATITLQAGHTYDLRLDYFRGPSSAVAQLSWSSPSTAKQIIPATALSHPTTGGYYDEIDVQNVTRDVTLYDDFIYIDPSGYCAALPVNGSQSQSATLRLPTDHNGS